MTVEIIKYYDDEGEPLGRVNDKRRKSNEDKMEKRREVERLPEPGLEEIDITTSKEKNDLPPFLRKIPEKRPKKELPN